MPESDSIRLFLWVILLLPLLSGTVWLLAGRRVNKLSGLLSVLLTLVGLGLATWVAASVDQTTQSLRTEWISLVNFSVPIAFRLDSLTFLMLVIVHFIALLVQLYSTSYLHDEPDRYRYFGYLGLFIGSMIGIVLAGNLIMMYAFWELVGLSSYLLIGFWFRKPEAATAAKKAFIMNRIGDAGFLLGIFLTYFQTGTTDFTDIVLTFDPTNPLATLTGLCLFCGCVGKSAQFPLSTWLPDAMEGPTPVSALIHAATMVAAGIFLLARIHFMLTPDALTVIVIIGTITMILAAYTALFQNDIKKVLAYSTVSQLGLLVIGMGTGNVTGALFHLTTHAFFKAGLFLAAGSVIHGAHTQDMRRMGGLRRLMPVTFIGYLICAAALAGLPLFSGFLSKEAILTGAVDWAQEQGGVAMLVPILALLSSGLTATYMARQTHMVFLGKYRGSDASTVHESDWRMTGPVILLAALSLGLTFSWNPLSAHHSWFYHLFPDTSSSASHEAPGFEPILIGILSVMVAVAGLLIGYFLPPTDSQDGPETLHNRWLFRPFYTFAQFLHQFDHRSIQRLRQRDWNLDSLYQRAIIQPTLILSKSLYRFDQRIIDGAVHLVATGNVVLAHMISWVDRSIVDGLVNGGAWLAGRLGQLTRSVQSGRIQSYIVSAVIGLLLIVWLLL